MRRTLIVATVGVAAVALAGAGAVSASAGQERSHAARSTNHDNDKLHQTALEAGIQVAPKHKTLPQVKYRGKTVNAANPYLAQVPDPSKVDYAYWKRLAHRDGARKADGKINPPTPFVYDEQEPDDVLGSNDSQANAEQIAQFGRGGGKTPAVRVLGSLLVPLVDTDDLTTTEDQGSIPLATDTGIPDETAGVTVSSEIGDGPHGEAGDGSGDFDYFKVTASAGETIRASTAGSDFDTILFIWDADGNAVAANDDANGTLQSELSFVAPEDGDYFVMVTGFLCLPDDPFDSASGSGAEDEGDYDLEVSVGVADADYYAVRLKAGDVLGGSIRGGSTDLQVKKPDGEERILSDFADASFIYPSQSPLPGADGGNASFAYVAEEPGWYTVSTSNGEGDYNMLLEVYRPGAESAGAGKVQTIFLDFDGERVNTGIFGGAGVSTLSPLSAFLGRWGLPNNQLNPLIDQVVATVKENIKQDLVAQGLNPDVKVKVLNSRDNPDPFGNPNVSRVIVGGTIEQSGVFTIGIAQSIDPGNFGHEETALVLLDILSNNDPEDDASLNFYITPSSDKVKFIGTALGNVVSHETGHFVGSFHVDQFNDVLNLMDQGGNFPLLYGVGDDGIGGTADDPDVDFGVDTYNPNEGFQGLENTLNNTAWAFRQGK